MVRNPRRKTCIGLHSEKDMAEAILMVEGGVSLRKAANKNNIKFTTLRRYVLKKKKCSEQEARHLRLTPNYANRTVFSVDQENTLHEYIAKCSRVSDGIDTVECRKLAYEMAVYYNLKIPKNWEANKMAGIEWFYGFRKRLSKSSKRKPEPGSLTPKTSLNPQKADDSDCSEQWCHKRDYYVRPRKGKPGTSSSGETASNRADLLSFLDSLPSSQINTITNAVDEDPEDTSAIMDITDDNSEQTQTLEDGAIKRENTRDSEETQSQEIEFFMCDNNDDNEHDKAKSDKTRKYDDDGLAEFHKQKIAQNELDENDLFFSSMAKIVKKLPRYEQVKLRLQIGSLVGNTELRHISSNHADSSDDEIS